VSKCISWHGEYSEHELDADYICTLCFVLDEEALIEELHRLREKLATGVAANNAGRASDRSLGGIERAAEIGMTAARASMVAGLGMVATAGFKAAISGAIAHEVRQQVCACLDGNACGLGIRND
jgi:hypothetical protein